MTKEIIKKTNTRDSNIELLRIILMCVIIAHHYIVNSGIGEAINNTIDNFTIHMGGGSCLALIFGWGGKTAINCFVLITGYFMCRKDFKWSKFLGLYAEVKLYRLAIYLIFLFTGYEFFSIKELFNVLLCVELDFGNGFTGSFLALYVLIPFINIFITNINQNIHKRVILVLIILFSFIPTFCYNFTYDYISWYVTIYLIGSYIRIYPNNYLDNKIITGVFSVISIFISWLSVIFIYLASVYMHKMLPYYWFIADSNKILALVTSVLVFCFFKNLKIGQKKVINIISSATFGVLLIHASSDTMRKWLWKDICANLYHFENDSAWWFILHAVFCTLIVYTVCVIIDLIRQYIQRKIIGRFLCQKKTQLQ